MIYKNALASCMSKAIYDKLSLELSAPLNNQYKYSIERVVFEGWKVVYGVENNDEMYNN